MINHIIHQTWKTKDIPNEFKGYVASWRKYNPDWEYRLWTDGDCLDFIEKEYPWFLSQYQSYKTNILRADAVRYFILYHYGGLYVDLDFECLQPMSSIMSDNHALFFGAEPMIHSQRLYGLDQLVCNALMGSVPGHSFWPHVFNQLKENQNKRHTIEATGPFMLQDAVNTYDGKDLVYIYSDTVFYPLPCLFNRRLKLSQRQIEHYESMVLTASYPEESIAVHHWAGTWWKKWHLRYWVDKLKNWSTK
tara:strand:- start:1109 stop:1852 length:744 start_codon:yes stop_codon:yes gene_type:complete